jgi:hypothetical protein
MPVVGGSTCSPAILLNEWVDGHFLDLLRPFGYLDGACLLVDVYTLSLQDWINEMIMIFYCPLSPSLPS